MEVIFGILTLMGGAILVLLKKLGKLESDKRLNDIKVEDVKLEEKQNQVKEEKQELKQQLAEIDDQKSESLSDEGIEKFWGEHKK
jgi:hypothetical protein